MEQSSHDSSQTNTCTFTWRHHDGAELWGSMNNWSFGFPLVNNSVTLNLNAGSYEYKFKVGNEWYHEMTKPTVINNSIINNIRKVEPRGIITIVHISDTHSLFHNELHDGEILILTGDATIGGHPAEYIMLNDWLGKFDHKHKILVLGNHDLDYFTEHGCDPIVEVRKLITNAKVASHADGFFNIMGINFYAREWFYPHTWDYRLKKEFSDIDDDPVYKIPTPLPMNGLDVLLTHGPARGHCDIFGTGSLKILQEIKEKKPKLHLFGHIHSQYGVSLESSNDNSKNGNDNFLTILINSSSVCEDSSKIVNKPHIIKYDTNKRQVIDIYY